MGPTTLGAGGGFLLMLWAGAFQAAGAAETRCIVCGADPAAGDAAVTYRGVVYPVCEDGCRAAWRRAEQDGTLDGMVQKVEPRGALFQGDSRFLNPTFQEDSPMPRGWFLAGVGILLAVVSSGAAGALAVTTHRPVPGAFALGFLLPGIGVAASLLLPRGADPFGLRGTKIARTHAEASCPACGHALHPSAAGCPGCGRELEPAVESEVRRIGKS